MGFLFQDGDAPYTQSISFPVAVGDTWTAFSYPFHAAKKYAPGEALAVLLLGYPVQTIAVGGFVITNFGDTETMENLSKTDITYGGREADASWRTAAEERIETYRKGDLAVVVTDADRNPVEDAEVSVRMTRHHFGFGAAINAHDMRFELGETDLEKYEAAVPELFNTVVLENTLK
jgi:endo-1,4-beta-xylanase